MGLGRSFLGLRADIQRCIIGFGMGGRALVYIRIETEPNPNPNPNLINGPRGVYISWEKFFASCV